MDKTIFEKEMEFQLLKAVIDDLLECGLLTSNEVVQIKKAAQDEIKPLIGILEDYNDRKDS